MDSKEFGMYLKKARSERKLTLSELSKLSGLSQPYLSQIENGKRGIPSPENIRKLYIPLRKSFREMMVLAGHFQNDSEYYEDSAKEIVKKNQHHSEAYLNDPIKYLEFWLNRIGDDGYIKKEFREFISSVFRYHEVESLSKDFNIYDLVREISTNEDPSKGIAIGMEIESHLVETYRPLYKEEVPDGMQHLVTKGYFAPVELLEVLENKYLMYKSTKLTKHQRKLISVILDALILEEPK